MHSGKCVSLVCLYLMPVLGTDGGPIQGNLDELVQFLEDGYICIKMVEVQDTLVMRYNMKCRYTFEPQYYCKNITNHR